MTRMERLERKVERYFLNLDISHTRMISYSMQKEEDDKEESFLLIEWVNIAVFGRWRITLRFHTRSKFVLSFESARFDSKPSLSKGR